jgi:CRP-like cAMP-binding protein
MILKLLLGTTYKDLEDARSQLLTEKVPAGVTLMECGDVDPTLILVEEGDLTVDIDGAVMEQSTRGAILGEVALFSSEPRRATVKTTTPATISILSQDGYRLLRVNENTVAYAIERAALMQLGKRVTKAEKRVAPLLPERAPTDTIVSRWTQFLAWCNGNEDASARPVELDKQTAINDVTLFSKRRYADLVTIVNAMEAIACDAGTVLQTEGELATHWYILLQGTVEARHVGEDGGSIRLTTLNKGKFFGLTSAMADAPNYCSGVAITNCTLLSMTRKKWLTMFHENSVAASTLRVAVIQNMIYQLNMTTDKVLRHE